MRVSESVYLGKSDFVFLQKQLIKSNGLFSNAVRIDLDDYGLFLSGGLNFSIDSNKHLVIVGEIYSAENPQYSNQDILNLLSERETFEELIKASNSYGGRFFMLALFQDQWHVVGDACCQFEVFYHWGGQVFASNVSLVSACRDIAEWSGEAKEVYDKIQKGDQIPVGQTTRLKSVKHLLPNHFLVAGKSVQKRYFPTVEYPVAHMSLDKAVSGISAKLVGLTKAFSSRYALVLPVTAGYDSRLLLAATKGLDAETFIFRHPNMAADFYDITVARQLCVAVNRKFEVIQYDQIVDESIVTEIFSEPPRKFREPVLINGMKTRFLQKLFLSGNIGEIGRTYYPELKGIDAKLLAKLLGFAKSEFVIGEMNSWLESLDKVSLGSKNVLDLFYWEIRMGTWGALAMTEYAAVSPVVSPMNSHAILSGFLGVHRKHRTYYRNELFDALIVKLDSRLHQFPINPNRKTTVIKILVRLHLYNLYRNFLFKIQS